MNSNPGFALWFRWRRRVLTASCWFLAAAALTVASASPGYAYSWYSGASVGSNGTVYAWGTTDAYYTGFIHTAYVTTTLTSPNGRVANSGQRSGTNYVRADVSLVWDPGDLGSYRFLSSHSFFCMYMGNNYFPNSEGVITQYDFTETFSPTEIRPNGLGGTVQTTVTVQTNLYVSRSVTLQDVRL